MTLQEIRKRLDGVGESWSAEENSLSWDLYEMNEEGHGKKIIKAPKKSSEHAEYWPTDAESDFIKHAPEDIKELLEIIDEGREIVEEISEADDEFVARYSELIIWADEYLKKVRNE